MGPQRLVLGADVPQGAAVTRTILLLVGAAFSVADAALAAAGYVLCAIKERHVAAKAERRQEESERSCDATWSYASDDRDELDTDHADMAEDDPLGWPWGDSGRDVDEPGPAERAFLDVLDRGEEVSLPLPTSLLAVGHAPPLYDAVTCDADGCGQAVHALGQTTAHDLDALALRAGWRVTTGGERTYHHCPRHRGDNEGV